MQSNQIFSGTDGTLHMDDDPDACTCLPLDETDFRNPALTCYYITHCPDLEFKAGSSENSMCCSGGGVDGSCPLTCKEQGKLLKDIYWARWRSLNKIDKCRKMSLRKELIERLKTFKRTCDDDFNGNKN